MEERCVVCRKTLSGADTCVGIMEERCVVCRKTLSGADTVTDRVQKIEMAQTKESIKSYALQRGDSVSEMVKRRIQNVDLVAVQAKYHRTCYDKFRLPTTEGSRKRIRTQRDSTVSDMDEINTFQSHNERLISINDSMSTVSEESSSARSETVSDVSEGKDTEKQEVRLEALQRSPVVEPSIRLSNKRIASSRLSAVAAKIKKSNKAIQVDKSTKLSVRNAYVQTDLQVTRVAGTQTDHLNLASTSMQTDAILCRHAATQTDAKSINDVGTQTELNQDTFNHRGFNHEINFNYYF